MKKPGRELDAEIAVKVMGLEPCDAWRYVNFGSAGGPGLMKDDGDCHHERGKCYPRQELAGVTRKIGGPPCYSTDIAAAWLVVEKMQEKGQVLALVGGDEWENVKMVARAPRVFQWAAVFDAEGFRPYSLAPTAPHAICLAALAAIGEG